VVWTFWGHSTVQWVNLKTLKMGHMCGAIDTKVIQTIEPRNLARAKALYAAKSNTIAEIMQMTGFKSRNTFYKYVVNGDKQE
jgi:hypothetical protein